jgi:hypothetical protein
MSLFIRLISCWKTPQKLEIAYLSFKKSKLFWGDMLSKGSHLRWSTQLSQNPSYAIIYCPMTYTY